MNVLETSLEWRLERARLKYLRHVIPNIGSITVLDDCILCKVRKNLLEENAKKVFYELFCYGIDNSEKNKSVLSNLDINKPVSYLFDGITFDAPITISAFCSNIIFRNCTFQGQIHVMHADSITFENNRYQCFNDSRENKNAFLSGNIDKLIFKNESFANDIDSNTVVDKFGIHVTSKRVVFEKSRVIGEVNIVTKESMFADTEIDAPKIYLDSDMIYWYPDSLMKASGSIIIKNASDSCDTEMGFYNVVSPYVEYNGREIYFRSSTVNNKSLVLK